MRLCLNSVNLWVITILISASLRPSLFFRTSVCGLHEALHGPYDPDCMTIPSGSPWSGAKIWAKGAIVRHILWPLQASGRVLSLGSLQLLGDECSWAHPLELIDPGSSSLFYRRICGCCPVLVKFRLSPIAVPIAVLCCLLLATWSGCDQTSCLVSLLVRSAIYRQWRHNPVRVVVKLLSHIMHLCSLICSLIQLS